jgi:hypothetical protein
MRGGVARGGFGTLAGKPKLARNLPGLPFWNSWVKWLYGKQIRGFILIWTLESDPLFDSLSYRCLLTG